jgi:hypothetical protein
MEQEYYIITTRHRAIWPTGVLLFWGPDHCGYAATLENAGKYSEYEAKKICDSGRLQTEFMVPCEEIEKASRRIVGLGKMKDFTGKNAWEFE